MPCFLGRWHVNRGEELLDPAPSSFTAPTRQAPNGTALCSLECSGWPSPLAILLTLLRGPHSQPPSPHRRPQPLTFREVVVLSGFPEPVPLGQAAVPLRHHPHLPSLPQVSDVQLWSRALDARPLWITWVLAIGEAEVFRHPSFDVRYRLLCAAAVMPVCSESDVPRR